MGAPTACIVVAEDEPDLLLLISVTLAAEGWEVVEAADGHAALAAARARRPDLLVLDVMLPGLTGPDIARALRADPAAAATLIVMLSARGQREDIAAGLAAGADRYLVKPFIPGDLAGIVRDLLGRRPPP
ncbi:MAG: response regulator transcription factor [Chloroflexota bacterium]